MNLKNIAKQVGPDFDPEVYNQQLQGNNDYLYETPIARSLVQTGGFLDKVAKASAYLTLDALAAK